MGHTEKMKTRTILITMIKMDIPEPCCKCSKVVKVLFLIKEGHLHVPNTSVILWKKSNVDHMMPEPGLDATALVDRRNQPQVQMYRRQKRMFKKRGSEAPNTTWRQVAL